MSDFNSTPFHKFNFQNMPGIVQVQQSSQSQNTTAGEVVPKESAPDDKKLQKALIGLAVILGAGVSVALCAKNGKVKLSDINFEKGIAKKNGNNFTGVVSDFVGKGSGKRKLVMQYANGELQNSKLYSSSGETLSDIIYRHLDINGQKVLFVEAQKQGQDMSACLKGSNRVKNYVLRDGKFFEKSRFETLNDSVASIVHDFDSHVVYIKGKPPFETQRIDVPLDFAEIYTKFTDINGKTYYDINMQKIKELAEIIAI